MIAVVRQLPPQPSAMGLRCGTGRLNHGSRDKQFGMPVA